MFQMPGSHIIPYKGTRPVVKEGVLVASGAQLIGDLVIEEDASVWFNVVIRADCHWVRIGARTNVQDGTVVHVTQASAPTTIGRDCTIGHGAVIHGCTIETGCLVGMGAIILDHAVIGEQSLVAAGTVVTPGKVFPPRSMIMGAPGKVVRPLLPQEITALGQSVAYYLEYKKGYMP